jgi:DNA primase
VGQEFLINILESFLGEHRKHNENTGQAAFDCPACSYENDKPNGDGKGNLEINYERGVFKCWACKDTNNMYGPVRSLLKRYATPRITRDYFLIKPEDTSFASKEIKEVESLPMGYRKFSQSTKSDFKYTEALNYLYGRGITDEIIKKFDLGYTTEGKYFDRVVIPSYDIYGILNYFVCRWFPKKKTKVKYLNPDADKQEIIFNERFLNYNSTIILVEGPTDHIVTPNSVPLLGKVLSPKLLELLHDNANANIIIFLDDDAIKDTIRLYKELNFGDLFGRIRICIPPISYDPSKIFQDYGYKGIIDVLRTSRFPTQQELDYI